MELVGEAWEVVALCRGKNATEAASLPEQLSRGLLLQPNASSACQLCPGPCNQMPGRTLGKSRPPTLPTACPQTPVF